MSLNPADIIASIAQTKHSLPEVDKVKNNIVTQQVAGEIEAKKDSKKNTSKISKQDKAYIYGIKLELSEESKQQYKHDKSSFHKKDESEDTQKEFKGKGQILDLTE